MNAVHAESRDWLGRFWWLLAGLVLALEVFYFWSVPAIFPAPPAAEGATRFVWVSGAARLEELARDLPEPTLFALPSRDGVAGHSWLRMELIPYRIQELPQPSHWLRPNAGQWGAGLDLLLTNRAANVVAVSEKPDFTPVLPVPNAVRGAELKTRYEVHGDLARRPIIAARPLEKWPHNDVLKPSVIAVTVNPDGFVFSMILVQPSGSSGSEKADQAALEWVRALRFAAMGMGGSVEGARSLMSGQVLVVWEVKGK